jgi:hypothetical protein
MADSTSLVWITEKKLGRRGELLMRLSHDFRLGFELECTLSNKPYTIIFEINSNLYTVMYYNLVCI